MSGCRVERSERLLAARVAFLVLMILMSSIGCTRRNSLRDEAAEIHAEFVVVPSTPQVGAAEVSVLLSDSDGGPIQDAVVELKGDMTHPGMTPVLAEAVELADGLYVASMEWSMAGDWILTLQGQLPDGRTLVRQYAITVQGAAPGAEDQ